MKTMRVLSYFGILCLSLSVFVLQALPPVHNDNVIKNLKNYEYADRLQVEKQIQQMSQGAIDNEYRLGMVLYAAAKQGDENVYQETLSLLKQKLSQDTQSPSYKTWRLGRILLAANSIDDMATVNTTLPLLKQLLHDKNTAEDAFSAWGWGYLAALNNKEYRDAKQPMLSAAKRLTTEYQLVKQRDPKASEAVLQEKLSNALWAWVMDIQAAANAHDKSTFNQILQEMKSITGQSSIDLALSIGLKRLAKSNDYPAWAISIVYLAAVTMEKPHVYKTLEPALKNSIFHAKEVANHGENEGSRYGALAEATLAELDQILALARLTLR